MAGIRFYQSIMGKMFYEGTVPSIARTLERIADALERIASKMEENDG